MIEITRFLARQLRTVCRRALGVTNYSPPPVLFTAGPDGLRVQVQNCTAAVEYHVAGDYEPERICAPFELLADCEGRKAEPVTLEAEGKGRVVARWRDGSIPQITQYEAAKPPKTAFPALPAKMADNEPRLLGALRDAAGTAEMEGVRYATHCIQLRGETGQMVATDGRQLLVQSGFAFPWPGDLLVPATKVFAGRELPQDVNVAAGASEDWLTLCIGPWTLHLAIQKDGRFPKTEEHLRKPESALARATFSPGDTEFLLKNLKQMPGGSEPLSPVTIDLDGQVVVRAEGENQPKPMELVLTNSQASGGPLRLNTDRTYLGRALRLGLRNLCVFGREVPLSCHDGQRQYMWMPLSGDRENPSKEAVRITSPPDKHSPGGRTIPTIHPKPRRTKTTMPKTNTTAAANPQSNGSADDAGSLLEHAETVKESLKDALVKTNELIAALKRHHKQSKLVQSTLASLRQLHTIAG